MSTKKDIRARFRDAVFKRAQYVCQGIGCLFESTSKKAQEELDSHHICDRTLLPTGGYVLENGIALCKVCHEKAEMWHRTKGADYIWTPDELYALIGSSYETAWEASEKLSG